MTFINTLIPLNSMLAAGAAPIFAHASSNSFRPEAVRLLREEWGPEFRFYEQIVSNDYTPRWTTAFRTLIGARNEILSGRSVEEVGIYLDGAIHSLWVAASSDLSLLPSPVRIMVASAIEVVGRMTFWSGESEESSARTTTLFQAAATFLKEEESRDVRTQGPDIFEEDRFLARILIAILGWLDKSTLTETQREPIATLFARMGIVSASMKWVEQGDDYPHLERSLKTLFGVESGYFKNFIPLPPETYFECAQYCRPTSTSYQEYILSLLMEIHSHLERGALEDNHYYQRVRWKLHYGLQEESLPDDPDLLQIREILEKGNGYGPEVFDELIEHLGERTRPLSRRAPRLADFILNSR